MEIIDAGGSVHKAYGNVSSKKKKKSSVSSTDKDSKNTGHPQQQAEDVKQTSTSTSEGDNQFHPTGIQKAAILVMSLGSKASAEIFKHLSQEESKRLLTEIIRLKNVSNEQIEPVVKELSQLIDKGDVHQTGGTYYANYLLEKSFGKTKARDVISHLKSSMAKKPLHVLKSLDHSQIAQLLADEHPQTIAIILHNMKATLASKIIKLFPKNMQVQVAKRIAKIKNVDPSVLETISDGLKSKIEKTKEFLKSTVQAGGIDKLAEILQFVDKGTEKVIIEQLHSENPDLAEEVINRVFTFDDIIKLSDRDTKKLLDHVQDLTIMRALKGSSDAVKMKFFANMSEERTKEIANGIDVIGVLSTKEIQSAQNAIVKLVRQLMDRGTIVVQKGISEQDYFIE